MEPCKDCGCKTKEAAKDCKMADCACHKKEMSLQTRDVDGVEVFGIGEWNGNPISSRDLDTIVESFQKTWQRLKPAVWLGHEKDQRILRNTGLPAAGWVEGLRRVGSKLVADFKRVPAKVAELLDAGAYRRVSVGLLEKYRVGDEVYDLALQHVALLGAATPAVDNLQDIIALYEKEPKCVEYVFEPGSPATEEVMEIEKLKKELAEAVARFTKAEGELQALKDKDLAEAQAKLAAKDKEIAEAVAKFAAVGAKAKELEASVAAQKERADKAESEANEFKAKARSQQIEAKVDEYIRKGKLAPAQKATAVALLDRGLATGELKFTAGEKELKSAEELLFALIESGSGVAMNDGGQTKAGEAKRGDVAVIGEEFAKKVDEYAKEHKTSYKEAYVILKREAEKQKAA